MTIWSEVLIQTAAGAGGGQYAFARQTRRIAWQAVCEVHGHSRTATNSAGQVLEEVQAADAAGTGLTADARGTGGHAETAQWIGEVGDVLEVADVETVAAGIIGIKIKRIGTRGAVSCCAQARRACGVARQTRVP